MSMSDDLTEFDVPVEWIVDPSEAMPSANLFHVVAGNPGLGGVPEELFVHVAQARPPIIPNASSQEQFQQLMQGRVLTVIPFTGFGMTRSRARELGELLIRLSDQIDADDQRGRG